MKKIIVSLLFVATACSANEDLIGSLVCVKSGPFKDLYERRGKVEAGNSDGVVFVRLKGEGSYCCWISSEHLARIKTKKRNPAKCK